MYVYGEVEECRVDYIPGYYPVTDGFPFGVDYDAVHLIG